MLRAAKDTVGILWAAEQTAQVVVEVAALHNPLAHQELTRLQQAIERHRRAAQAEVQALYDRAERAGYHDIARDLWAPPQ